MEKKNRNSYESGTDLVTRWGNQVTSHLITLLTIFGAFASLSELDTPFFMSPFLATFERD
jgi:hypothetical protein